MPFTLRYLVKSMSYFGPTQSGTVPEGPVEQMEQLQRFGRYERLNDLNGWNGAQRWNVLNEPRYFSRECPAETIRSESHARGRHAWPARRLCRRPRGIGHPADCRVPNR